MLVAYYFLLK